MTHYRVTWQIDIEADTPEEAAQEALRIQRDPDSIATLFEVFYQDGELVARVDLIGGTLT